MNDSRNVCMAGATSHNCAVKWISPDLEAVIRPFLDRLKQKYILSG